MPYFPLNSIDYAVKWSWAVPPDSVLYVSPLNVCEKETYTYHEHRFCSLLPLAILARDHTGYWLAILPATDMW